jgi:hypothetical protein
LRTFELDEASRDAPRGSRAWALWIIGQAQLTRKELQLDAEILGSLLKQIDEFRAWEPLGLLDIETLALKELQLEPAVLRAVLGTKPGRVAWRGDCSRGSGRAVDISHGDGWVNGSK